MMAKVTVQSRVLRGRIEAWEDKVRLCRDKFSVPLLARMVSRCSRLIGGYQKLHSCNSLRHIRVMVNETKSYCIKTEMDDSDAFNTFHYFEWFFNIHEYLKMLLDAFMNRIYQPLLELYKTQRGFATPDMDSQSLRLLQLSPLTTDSGFSATSSGQFVPELDKTSEKLTPNNAASISQLTASTSPAIGQLLNDFGELRQLYDFTEIDQIVQRLLILTSSLEKLLSEGDIDKDLFSQDSFRAISYFKVKQPVLNVLRLVPDVLLKLEKAAWLANKWLRLSGEKTASALERLEKVESVESKMSHRLQKVKEQSKTTEGRLEKKAKELSSRLTREHRAGDLNISLYELDTKITMLQTELESARFEKEQIRRFLLLASERNQSGSLERLQGHYRRNQLQRYTLASRISSLSYKRALLVDDLKIELNLKPSIVAFTNSVQEICDRLETSLNEKCKEEKALERALQYIGRDKQALLASLRTNFVKDTGARNVSKIPKVSKPQGEIRVDDSPRYGILSPPQSESQESSTSRWSDFSVPPRLSLNLF